MYLFFLLSGMLLLKRNHPLLLFSNLKQDFDTWTQQQTYLIQI